MQVQVVYKLQCIPSSHQPNVFDSERLKVNITLNCNMLYNDDYTSVTEVVLKNAFI